MKKLFSAFLLVAFLFPAAGFSITNYSIGDQLNVLASSGLVLRETANPKGTKIGTIVLGETVTVLKDNFRKVPHSVLEFKNFNIRGYWVKVRTAGGLEGYVFDGYLSHYKAPGTFTIADDSGLDTLSMIEQYLAVHSPVNGPRINLPKGGRYDHYKQVFKNSAVVEASSGEGGAWYKISFNKGTSLEEGYLIGRLLWLEGKNNASIENGVITVNNETETQQIIVVNKGGTIILTMNIAD